MPTGSITTPANNGDDFPALIEGTYNVGGGVTLPKRTGETNPPAPADPCTIPAGLTVKVTITKASNASYKNEGNAVLRCGTNTTGFWEYDQPGDLESGQTDYVITATITHNGGSATYSKIDIAT